MRFKFVAEITVDTTTGQVYIDDNKRMRIVLSPPTRGSDSLVAVKNDIPVAEIFNTARQVSRFIIQSFSIRGKQNGQAE